MKTEYITFTDADDYVNSFYLERLYGLMVKSHGDLVISYHIVLREGGGRKLKSKKRADQRSSREAIVSSLWREAAVS